MSTTLAGRPRRAIYSGPLQEWLVAMYRAWAAPPDRALCWYYQQGRAFKRLQELHEVAVGHLEPKNAEVISERLRPRFARQAYLNALAGILGQFGGFDLSARTRFANSLFAWVGKEKSSAGLDALIIASLVAMEAGGKAPEFQAGRAAWKGNPPADWGGGLNGSIFLDPSSSSLGFLRENGLRQLLDDAMDGAPFGGGTGPTFAYQLGSAVRPEWVGMTDTEKAVFCGFVSASVGLAVDVGWHAATASLGTVTAGTGWLLMGLGHALGAEASLATGLLCAGLVVSDEEQKKRDAERKRQEEAAERRDEAEVRASTDIPTDETPTEALPPISEGIAMPNPDNSGLTELDIELALRLNDIAPLDIDPDHVAPLGPPRRLGPWEGVTDPAFDQPIEPLRAPGPGREMISNPIKPGTGREYSTAVALFRRTGPSVTAQPQGPVFRLLSGSSPALNAQGSSARESALGSLRHAAGRSLSRFARVVHG